jgi:hypothetical protein
MKKCMYCGRFMMIVQKKDQRYYDCNCKDFKKVKESLKTLYFLKGRLNSEFSKFNHVKTNFITSYIDDIRIER